MPATTINISKELDQKIRMYMAKNNISSKQKAIVQILDRGWD